MNLKTDINSLVGNMQSREVLPRQTGLVLRAAADIRSHESPGPGLWDTGLEPNRHRVKSRHLAENHFLASLGRNRLCEQLANLARV